MTKKDKNYPTKKAEYKVERYQKVLENNRKWAKSSSNTTTIRITKDLKSKIDQNRGDLSVPDYLSKKLNIK
jgi:hypothetical protein